MALSPFAWICETARVFCVYWGGLESQIVSIWWSMSKTAGATPVAPVKAVPVMFTLMPPGFWLASQVPEGVREACS